MTSNKKKETALYLAMKGAPSYTSAPEPGLGMMTFTLKDDSKLNVPVTKATYDLIHKILTIKVAVE